ncbi:MAG: hypothetical protein WD512_00570 [Candidatus Paceibacterota bacterium]
MKFIKNILKTSKEFNDQLDKLSKVMELRKPKSYSHYVLFDGTSYFIGSIDDIKNNEIIFSTNNIDDAQERVDQLNENLNN